MDSNRHVWLAERFEEHRGHLRTVAYRMLGSPSEADDAVQEAWLRLSRTEVTGVQNLGGWLTTVVARVCLDMLRTRRSRREEPLDRDALEPLARPAEQTSPEDEALLAEGVGLALLVVLETLSPAERLAFVLHDMFGVPFEEIAPIVERSPDAAKMLASRARRRVRAASGSGDESSASEASADADRQHAVVAAFLAASRRGDFAALLALLDPDVVMRSDGAATAVGATALARGAQAVATQFAGRARTAQLARIDGLTGVVWAPGGQVRVVFRFSLDQAGQIRAIDLLADPEQLRQLEVTILPA